jgi:transcriptional regulator with XRE-family HTH domain
MSTAARLLTDARKRAGLTQAELARRADIPRSVLNAYERGTRQPGADALASILEAAGFELHLRERIDPERNGRVLADVLRLADSLPFKAKRKLDAIPFRRRVGER